MLCMLIKRREKRAAAAVAVAGESSFTLAFSLGSVFSLAELMDGCWMLVIIFPGLMLELDNIVRIETFFRIKNRWSRKIDYSKLRVFEKKNIHQLYKYTYTAEANIVQCVLKASRGSVTLARCKCIDQ